MTQNRFLSSYQLQEFIQKLENASSQLLKDIRKNGEDNISTRFYLEQFKNFQRQLNLKQPLKETFTPQLIENIIVQQPQQPTTQKSQKTLMTDESLRPAVRRQLVLIQSQQTKCQEICKLISNVEQQIRQIDKTEQFTAANPEQIKDKLRPVYSIVEVWLKDLLKIVQDMIALLQNHLQSFKTSSIYFEKSVISPDSNSRSALTSIIESMNRSQKNKTKSEAMPEVQPERSSKVQKRIISKFEVMQKPLKSSKLFSKQIRPPPREKNCTQCLLF